jgi:hypothetical protein
LERDPVGASKKSGGLTPIGRLELSPTRAVLVGHSRSLVHRDSNGMHEATNAWDRLLHNSHETPQILTIPHHLAQRDNTPGTSSHISCSTIRDKLLMTIKLFLSLCRKGRCGSFLLCSSCLLISVCLLIWYVSGIRFNVPIAQL